MSLNHADAIALMICKLESGFAALKSQMPKSDRQKKVFSDLEAKLSRGVRNDRRLRLDDFVNTFSLLFPFPDAAVVEEFEVHRDLMKECVKVIDSSKCVIDMRMLSFNLEKMFRLCRVITSVSRYACGAVSMCMRPDYDDYSLILPDRNPGTFEPDRTVAEGGPLSKSWSKQPACFLEWMKWLNGLRRVMVSYLAVHNRCKLFSRLALEMVAIIEPAMKDIESNYNDYLDREERRTGWSAEPFASAPGEHEPLFKYSVRSGGIYENAFTGLSDVLGSYMSDEPGVLPFMRCLERNGVFPFELMERRKQFWDWVMSRKVERPVSTDMGELIDAVNASESAEFNAEVRDVVIECFDPLVNEWIGPFVFFLIAVIVSILIWRFKYS
ncbi:hypothetical protein THOM_0037 [Trachipleistophora hominis]|uniref:Uncharacterized protein n=1 Tax=Trachipleistophora hominis TaxID=72359 RepID=L7K0E7_TRAHO|nr:hypothetical protein THOM_0037 [Trachipleistophora hominis]